MTFISACQVCLDRFASRNQSRSQCVFCRKSEESCECFCTPDGRCQKKCDVHRVDLDYIATIEEHNGLVKLCKHPIDVPYKLLQDLGVEYRRKGSTCLDLQKILISSLPGLPGKHVDYISPHPYCVAYVNPFDFGEVITQEKYNEVLKQHHQQLVLQFEQSNPVTECKDIAKWERKKDEYVSQGLDELRISWRRDYMHQSLRAIAREFYDETFKGIKLLGDTLKMYSTDNIGWNNFNYTITNDIKVALQSNFGYGSASYFRIILTYKGIQIIAYSMYVNYYYANARDLCRYTRRYKVLWGSWDEALSFVEQVSNLAIKSQDDFEKRWIVDEINDMLRGLRLVVDTPEQVFDKWIEETSPKNADLLLDVRAVQKNVVEQYRCYPNEMLIDFQGEKISGALQFLDSLKKLRGIYSQVDNAINEILDMARQLLPRLESHADAAQRHIRELEQVLHNLNVARKECEGLISWHMECMSKEKKEQKYALGSVKDPVLMKMIEVAVEASYVKKHPELTQCKNKLTELKSKIDEVECDVERRKNFHRRLKMFRERILRMGIPSMAGSRSSLSATEYLSSIIFNGL